jgi:hypothetical protein
MRGKRFDDQGSGGSPAYFDIESKQSVNLRSGNIMPSPDERSATTVVIEMEPGWIYVKIAEPKPADSSRATHLRLGDLRTWGPVKKPMLAPQIPCLAKTKLCSAVASNELPTNCIVTTAR